MTSRLSATGAASLSQPSTRHGRPDLSPPNSHSHPVPHRGAIAAPTNAYVPAKKICAERYGVSGAEILLRCGERKLVGGQEDQIFDIRCHDPNIVCGTRNAN